MRTHITTDDIKKMSDHCQPLIEWMQIHFPDGIPFTESHLRQWQAKELWPHARQADIVQLTGYLDHGFFWWITDSNSVAPEKDIPSSGYAELWYVLAEVLRITNQEGRDTALAYFAHIEAECFRRLRLLGLRDNVS